MIDETTAIVRFIFPCGTPLQREPPLSAAHFEEVGSETLDFGDALEEAKHSLSFESLSTARLGARWKNRAPPPRNGSKYLPKELGM